MWIWDIIGTTSITFNRDRPTSLVCSYIALVASEKCRRSIVDWSIFCPCNGTIGIVYFIRMHEMETWNMHK
jgi:hypothetical protein